MLLLYFIYLVFYPFLEILSMYTLEERARTGLNEHYINYLYYFIAR